VVVYTKINGQVSVNSKNLNHGLQNCNGLESESCLKLLLSLVRFIYGTALTCMLGTWGGGHGGGRLRSR
jgi:hypothetical protein